MVARLTEFTLNSGNSRAIAALKKVDSLFFNRKGSLEDLGENANSGTYLPCKSLGNALDGACRSEELVVKRSFLFSGIF